MRIMVKSLREGRDPCRSRRGVLFSHDPSAPWPDECYDAQAIRNDQDDVGIHVTRNSWLFWGNVKDRLAWRVVAHKEHELNAAHDGSTELQLVTGRESVIEQANRGRRRWLPSKRDSIFCICYFSLFNKEMKTAFQGKYLYTQRTFETL